MRALADFGTPLLIGEGYRTFPVEIYNQYVGETIVNYNFAAAISVIAIIITALVFFLQKLLITRYQFSISALHTIERKQPKVGFSVFIHSFTYFFVTISMMPQIYLMYCSFRKTSRSGALFLPGFSLNSYHMTGSRYGYHFNGIYCYIPAYFYESIKIKGCNTLSYIMRYARSFHRCGEWEIQKSATTMPVF